MKEYARLVSVGIPIGIMRRYRAFSPWVVSILTWGGLRGGISVVQDLSVGPLVGYAQARPTQTNR